MIDILLLSLPIDHGRAGGIADALVDEGVAGLHRTRFVSAHPAEPDWEDVAQMAQACPCVIFCWSRATTALHIAPMRELHGQMLNKGQAIAVELDSQTRPDPADGCSTYPFHGWRAEPGWGQKFILGNGFATQIVAAAQQKVLGRNPPPPNAYRQLVRRQIWIMKVATASVLSVISTLLGLWTFNDFAKWRDGKGRDAYEAARNSGDCEALRKFDVKSAWYGDAGRLLATCKERDVKGFLKTLLPLQSAFNTNTVAESERMAREGCKGYAIQGAKLLDVQIVYKHARGVMEIGDRFTCIIDAPATKLEETMGGRVR